MIGIKSTALLALIVLTLPGATCLRAEERMRAGLWEVTIQHNAEPAAVSGNTCYTPAMVEFANMPAKMLREATEKLNTRRGCTLKSFKMDGNKMSMEKVCAAKSTAISSTYSGDAFETVDTSTEAGVITIIRMKGRRIGECK
jgi:Protein of unknown function (DUF3617)